MQIVDFIRDNWQFISSAILALLTIIAMIIKKKPVNKYTDDLNSPQKKGDHDGKK